MRAAGLFAIALAAAPIAAPRAESLELGDLYRRTQAMVQSLIGLGQDRRRDVIAPPGDIDPKMAFRPPPLGTMRVIRPTEPPEQWR